ncbi:DUF2635 domain-containing protein [Rhodopseudomonas sp. B29]|uniref:DUF2635 domain-containing protein n=1 Tax=Rhodopseudomonas sp. B29 TaxID=95607 RepID=UPI000345CE13|nr:DUF2635 domain-containing protein [Rhodopseudomonas sp. B29]
MSNMFIKPATIEIEGNAVVALVRDPISLAPLAEAGEWKPASQFWLRRVRDRDVIKTEPAAVASAAPVAFTPCDACAVPADCIAAARCVKAPIA